MLLVLTRVQMTVLQDGTNAGPYSHVADFSAIKELDLIAKEIDDMKRYEISFKYNVVGIISL